jgi:hypothetical protein
MDLPMRYLTLLLVLFTCQGVAAEQGLAFGSEYVSWRERASDGGGQLLEESGLRAFIDLSAQGELNESVDSDASLRIYSGRIAYDGQYQDGTPAESNTNYLGLQLRLDTLHPLRRGNESVLLGIEYEAWLRDILGRGGYEERYQLAAIRAGWQTGDGRDWRLNLGINFPFWLDERVALEGVGYASDVTLTPKGDFGFFIGYEQNLGSSWRLKGYYRGLRLRRSAGERVYYPPDDVYHEVHQPESHFDAIGIALGFRF